MWLFSIICLTYCFTVGLTVRYKEQMVDLREQGFKDKREFEVEISELLETILSLEEELGRMRNNYGRS